ncbi:MAG: hypothetical protein OXG91_01880 [bacterium]|nr:hypothetical protein [bacterium]
MSRARRQIGAALAAVAAVSAFVGSAAPVIGQDGDGQVPKRLVAITTPAIAGTYKVSWKTLGGCDPGSGTSGMAGEITLTVEADGTPDADPQPGELTGTQATEVVVTSPRCVYEWTVMMIEATTDGNCMVGPAPFEPDDDFRITITLDDPDTACSKKSRIVLRLNPAVPVDRDATDRNAVLRATFSATAVPTERAPKGCSTSSSATSEVDDRDTPTETDDIVTVELPVVNLTSAGESCRYDVSLSLPGHLVATFMGRKLEVLQDIAGLATVDVRVGVVSKTVFLLQTVVGDSGGAAVHYALSTDCEPPSPLPGVMPPPDPSNGIQRIEGITLVELREGRYNITAALADDPTAEDAFDGVPTRALGSGGEACDATVTLTRLPPQCLAETTDIMFNLATAPERVIFDFKVTCGDAVGGSTG